MRKIIMIIAGTIIALCGLLGGLAYLLGIFFSDGEAAVDSSVAAASFMALGVGLGGALAWQGKNALQGRPSGMVRWPPVWLLLLSLVIVIGTGHLLLTFNLLPALTFPLFHILAAAIPPLIILAYAGRALKASPLTWRDFIVQLSSGAFLSTSLAFMAEIILGLAIAILAFTVAAFTPSGQALIEQLSTNLSNPEWLQNPTNIEEILLSPPVLVTLLSLFVVLAPLIEEPAKMIGVILMSYRHPSRAQIFMWGLAGGAGFALVENLFNTVVALDAWAYIVILRFGGTLMHCLGVGLNALGWHQLMVVRRPWWLMGTLALSMSIHALWNGSVIIIAGTSLFVTGQSQTVSTMVGGAIAGLLLLFLLGLTVGMIILLVVITRRLRTKTDVIPLNTISEAVTP